VTCIAFTDATETLLLFTADQIHSHAVWTERVRERINRETGIPKDHIMLTATHTHSGPDIGAAIGDDEPYYNTYMDAFAGAAEDALADRSHV
jgi:chloramphenicol 3-O-phosphotransferase